MKPLTIGQVARSTGVGIETIRFYERKGLIEDPPRKESGYRQYPENTIVRLQFIRRAKELGFSLKEIEELISLRLGPKSTCGDVKRRAELKIAEIEEKVRDLKKMKVALVGLTRECAGGKKSTGDCPILGALDSQNR